MTVSTLGATLAKGQITDQKEKVTFVLVHGAWHGGWCWKKVVPLLESAGHRVFTPTLTGLGERAHLLGPQIDLSTHIQDIAAVLEYEDLRNVVLVCHSYAGMVISGLAEKTRKRLAQLVYFDAFLPENGKSFKDYTPTIPLNELVRKPGVDSLKALGVTDSADVAWMLSRLGDQPPKTITQPVRITADTGKSLRRTFIQTSQYFTKEAEKAKKQGFRYYELLSAGHDAMVTKPKELVKIFLELV